jgi:hypothetical protein
MRSEVPALDREVAPRPLARPRPFLLHALCALFVCAVPGRAAVVERILAVVDQRPVMLSEVETLARLRGIDRAAALELAIDAHLMLAEARRLRSAGPAAEAEQRAFESLLARWPAGEGPPPEAELRRLARREVGILEHVERRFASQIRVSEEELAAAEAAEPDAPPEVGAERREALRERLAAQRLDERIEAWVKELRAGAEIRINP